MAAGVQRGGTNPLVNTDGSGGHRPEVIAYSPGGTGANPQQGAASVANSQVTTSGTAGTLAIARPTRRTLTVKNIDSSISVYIGVATVTAANGMEVKAGQSITVTAVVLWQVIAASGTPVVCIIDEYD